MTRRNRWIMSAIAGLAFATVFGPFTMTTLLILGGCLLVAGTAGLILFLILADDPEEDTSWQGWD
jgi:hypothetical protein